MRKTEHTGQFKRDYRRVAVGRHRSSLDALLGAVLPLLATDVPLPAKYRDHALIGEWSDHRDCHLKPDLVLIYRKPDKTTLQLVRLGSHSEPGL
ncbi:addiction module antitoxin [Burkholderia cepacia]|uniref:type II toxin-antitoxin system YafQ family toxin n=1 Tax=Burkholderia cepacia TaxID=292 RepID=UPI000758A9ED|nr:type II toxin-antitoxin system YafQ family toxin [Burkholderia cepacia]KUY84949.1 addiction module antitoxin [Burkholderia cepacia]